MIFFPVFGQPSGPTLGDVRTRALASAIVLRDCARSVQTSSAGRRACRNLMRLQAIQWRQPSEGS